MGIPKRTKKGRRKERLILEIEGKETENEEDIINHVRKYWEEIGKIQEEKNKHRKLHKNNKKE